MAVVSLRHPFGLGKILPSKWITSLRSVILLGSPKRIQNLRLRRCFFVSLYSLKQAWLVQKTKKPRNDVVLNSFGGERGIRTPGPVTVNSFQDYRNRPLCHLSAANVGREKQFCKKMPNLFMNSMVLIT